MVKRGIVLLAVISTMMFAGGCASTESSKVSTESQKKVEEVWITKEVGNDQFKYSYKVPEGSRTLSKEELKEMEEGAATTSGEVGKVAFDSGFVLSKEKGAEFPLVASARFVEKGSEMFKGLTTIMNDPQAVQKQNPSAMVICENDKELIEAIQNKPYETMIISKNRKTAYITGVEQIENEKCKLLMSMHMGSNSITSLSFLEKEGEFNKSLPLFFKIEDTVTLAK